MILRVRRGSPRPDHEIEAGRRIQGIGNRPKPTLHAIAHNGTANCLAGNEAKAGDVTFMRNYAQDEQLVSVDTTLAVRGSKVFAPAYSSLFVHGLAGYST